MQNYFNSTCRNIEDAKAQYKDLYKFHCNDANVMAEINLQFTEFKTMCDTGVITGPTKPQAEPNEPTEGIVNLAKIAAAIEGCTVEVCGSWIWAKCDRDNTQAHEILKANKFRFSGTKKAWYFTNQPYKKRRGTKTLQQIKGKFGVMAVTETE